MYIRDLKGRIIFELIDEEEKRDVQRVERKKKVEKRDVQRVERKRKMRTCIDDVSNDTIKNEILVRLNASDAFNFGMTCVRYSQLVRHHLHVPYRLKSINSPFSLKRHQIDTVLWMLRCEKEKLEGIRGGIVSLLQGLGKTLCTLYLCFLSKRKGPFLIVVKKSAISVWVVQLAQFFGNRMSHIVFHKEYIGPLFDKITHDELGEYDIVITTYNVIAHAASHKGIVERALVRDSRERIVGVELVTKPMHSKHAQGTTTLFTRMWYRIVTDEIHYIVNPKTAAFRGLMAVCAEKRWGLSGTPLRNKHADMFSLLRFLGYDGCTNEKTWTVTHKELFPEIASRILYMSYEDAGIYLPSLRYIDSKVSLSDYEMRKYATFHAAAKEIKDSATANRHSYMNILVQLTKLRQCCLAPYLLTRESKVNASGAHYDTDESLLNIKGKPGFQSAKMRKILEIVSAHEEKYLIFSTFSSALHLAGKMFASLGKIPFMMIDGTVTGVERANIIEEFETSKTCRILMMTFKTGSESLNLTCATNVIIIDPWWCPVEEEQAISRAWRMGQKHKVNVFRIIAEGTVDERIMDVWRHKKEIAQCYRSSGDAPTGKKLSAADLYYILGF